MKKIKKEFFYGNSANVSATYDLKDKEGKKSAIRILIGFFAPIIIFVLPGVSIILNEGKVVLPVILFFAGIFLSMYCSTSMLIYNKEHELEPNRDEIESAKVIRSIMVIIFACMTYIPFLCYIFALIFSKKYPNSPFYTKGFNVQTFTLIWSLISLFGLGLIYLVFNFL